MNLNSIDLANLPRNETNRIEYKSGKTPPGELRKKLQKAASGFWNSGGGVFVVGVNDDGEVDFGIETTVGRQAIEDWLSQCLAEVQPTGKYTHRLFGESDHTAIEADRCVLAVEFSSSNAIPHQAPDNKYYIRVGAHTAPASHFIVEALYAKRNSRVPVLRHLAWTRFSTQSSGSVFIEIIAVNNEPAFSVEINLDPLPDEFGPIEQLFPMFLPVIDRDHPFRFGFDVPLDPDSHEVEFTSQLTVNYQDSHGNEHLHESLLNSVEFPPRPSTEFFHDALLRKAGEIATALEGLSKNLNQ